MAVRLAAASRRTFSRSAVSMPVVVHFNSSLHLSTRGRLSFHLVHGVILSRITCHRMTWGWIMQRLTRWRIQRTRGYGGEFALHKSYLVASPSMHRNGTEVVTITAPRQSYSRIVRPPCVLVTISHPLVVTRVRWNRMGWAPNCRSKTQLDQVSGIYTRTWHRTLLLVPWWWFLGLVV